MSTAGKPAPGPHGLSRVGQIAAGGAVVLAAVVVVLVLLGGGSSYTISADFQNASQIVSGDLVEVAGTSIGTVGKIDLTPDGHAQLTLNITDKSYEPLPQSTDATIREVSLSGVANRYVDLDLGTDKAGMIPDHGQIAVTHTTSEVDLDQLFDTLDAPTRLGLQNLIQGTAAEYRNAGATAHAAFQYLNPAVAATSQLFQEINQNTGSFTRFITTSGHLMADISSRQEDLSQLIENLSEVTGSLSTQDPQLASSINQLPGFLSHADTTFANLRGTLHTLTPLINATKPVAPRLDELLTQLRPLAKQAIPAVENLATTISKPGADNDLIDLTNLAPGLAKATVDNVSADGRTRPGAFPETVKALTEAAPELAFARPYAVDLTGWFDDFSHPGGYDANGAYSRVAPVVSVASLNNGGLNLLDSLLTPSLRSALTFNSDGVTTDDGDRCPGSMERGALYYPESGYACSPDQVPNGR